MRLISSRYGWTVTVEYERLGSKKQKQSAILTRLPLEPCTLKRTRSAFGVVHFPSGKAVIVRVERLGAIRPLVAAVGCPGWCEEWVAATLLGLVNLGVAGKVGVVEDSCGIGIDGLGCPGVGCSGLLASPHRRQRLLARRQLLEALAVVAEPEVELQVLGRQFNVLEEVHEVAHSAWLEESARVDRGRLEHIQGTRRQK